MIKYEAKLEGGGFEHAFFFGLGTEPKQLPSEQSVSSCCFTGSEPVYSSTYTEGFSGRK